MISNQKIIKFKKALHIQDTILGIHFSDTLPNKFQHRKDTACTAIARAFLNKETLVFDAKYYPQLCPGANFFLKLSKVDQKKIEDVYIKDEHIFKNKTICNKFLKSLPKFPNYFKNKFIIIKPLKIKDKPQIIILLVNPAQASRIIGLLNYGQYKKIKIFPNQSACLSLFTPIITKLPHINFIDYYDRYYQGKINNKNIWAEDKMIISLRIEEFINILNNLDKSPQGTFKGINVDSQIVDEI
ncbi:MAG: DUF169 domain-containing protein [Candidatus Kuenenbacteria bacterium]